MKKVVDELFKLQDIKYRDFNSKLLPQINKENIIGVKIPIIREYAREFIKSDDYILFLNELPHKYLEENLLHGALLSIIKDTDYILDNLDSFLIYVDNWEVTDLIKPKIFKKDLKKVYNRIVKWIDSSDTYKIRFAVVMLLTYYLDNEFDSKINDLVLSINSSEYYVNMAIAWYFSFALIKQYDKTIYIFENKLLSDWLHNKSIQKAIESRRIDNSMKDYLRSLKVR